MKLPATHVTKLTALLCMLFTTNLYADVGAPFEVKMVVLENGETRHIKYNIHSGETWWSSTTQWQKIEEPEPISRSTYDYTMVSTGMYWRLIRVDKLTGDAWKNSSGRWVKFTTKPKEEEVKNKY